MVVRLIPQTSLATGKVILILTGLNEGEVVEEQIKRLTNVVQAQEIEKDEPINVEFTMPSPTITEYQVKCVWGDEALSYVARVEKSERPITPERTSPAASAATAPQADGGGLLLDNLIRQKEELPCGKASCDYVYVLKFDLVNRTQQIVTMAKLAMGMLWLEEGQDLPTITAGTELRADEQIVELNGITIAPGQAKKVSIKIDKPLAAIPGGGFVPTLRIIKYSSSSHDNTNN